MPTQVIPSTYRGCDGRSHSIQRIRGSFLMLTADIGEGNPDLETLTAAIKHVVGVCSLIIYMTASSQPDNRKWRVLVPLTEAIAGSDFADTQNAFYDLLAEQGVVCDRALARPGQPVFLPNVPPKRRDSNGAPIYYQCNVVYGVKAELTAGHNIIVHREKVRAEIRAEKLIMNKRREKLKEERQLRTEKFRGIDEAIRPRVCLVPFEVTIPESERDPELENKLKDEWPEILRWAIDGAVEWQKQGLNPPERVLVASEEYLESEDLFGQFLSEMVVEDKLGDVSSKQLYNAHHTWSVTSGLKPWTIIAFGKAMTERGFKRTHAANARGYSGLKLREDPEI